MQYCYASFYSFLKAKKSLFFSNHKSAIEALFTGNVKGFWFNRFNNVVLVAVSTNKSWSQ